MPARSTCTPRRTWWRHGTRRALGGADVWLWVVLGALFVAMAVPAALQGSVGVAAFYAMVGLVTAAGSLPFLRRGQAAVRARYPIGTTLRGAVTEHGLTLAGSHTTVWTPWEIYRGHRVDDRTLQLRRVDRAHGGVQTVPVGLFSPSVLKQIIERVPQGL